jgi:transposase-like protein
MPRKTYTREFKLQALRMMTDQGLSVAEVARRLGVRDNLLRNWKKGAKAHGNGAFPGHGNPSPAEDHHEAIIDRPTFEQAQVVLAQGKTGRGRYTPEENPFILTGVLRCGRCGCPLWAVKNHAHNYYECGNRQYNGPDACEGTTVGEDVVLRMKKALIVTDPARRLITERLRIYSRARAIAAPAPKPGVGRREVRPKVPGRPSGSAPPRKPPSR